MLLIVLHIEPFLRIINSVLKYLISLHPKNMLRFVFHREHILWLFPLRKSVCPIKEMFRKFHLAKTFLRLQPYKTAAWLVVLIPVYIWKVFWVWYAGWKTFFFTLYFLHCNSSALTQKNQVIQLSRISIRARVLPVIPTVVISFCKINLHLNSVGTITVIDEIKSRHTDVSFF